LKKKFLISSSNAKLPYDLLIIHIFTST